jgi:carbon dioxide concentrating mechanism protein CcmK
MYSDRLVDRTDFLRFFTKLRGDRFRIYLRVRVHAGALHNIMGMAVGMIETVGYPAVLAASDAMLKSARVALVNYESCASGRYMVTIRGAIAEVRSAMAAGIEMVEKMPGDAEVTAHIVIPNPPDNLEAVLPIDYVAAAESFRI